MSQKSQTYCSRRTVSRHQTASLNEVDGVAFNGMLRKGANLVQAHTNQANGLVLLVDTGDVDEAQTEKTEEVISKGMVGRGWILGSLQHSAVTPGNDIRIDLSDLHAPAKGGDEHDERFANIPLAGAKIAEQTMIDRFILDKGPKDLL